MKKQIHDIIVERNTAIMNNFCQQGNFMTDGGPVPYVCKNVNATELLEFINAYDDRILAEAEKSKES